VNRGVEPALDHVKQAPEKSLATGTQPPPLAKKAHKKKKGSTARGSKKTKNRARALRGARVPQKRAGYNPGEKRNFVTSTKYFQQSI
jgi:hypothetical protein